MLTSTRIISALAFLLLAGIGSSAQQNPTEPMARPAALTVTAAASDNRVRFTAPSSVVQMHLEVYTADGQKLFDLELKRGNVLDWHLQDGQTERLSDGSYLCVVTAKDLSGKLTQKIGTVAISAQQVSINPARASELKSQQAQAIGPLEEDSMISVLKEDEPVTTVVAHNGEEGQISRGGGPLTFRLGDFFRGKDTEQMRLTEEGNLGIGVTNPQVRLDVAGRIRATEGIIFPDGSVQLSAARKTLGAASQRPGMGGKHDQEQFETQSVLATQNFMAKFTDNAGTLGNSLIFDNGSNLGIGTTSPQSGLDYRNTGAAFFTRDIGTTNFGTAQSALQLGLSNLGSRNAGVGPGFLFFGENSAGVKSFLGRVSGVWENPTAGAEAGALFFQVRANSGDVNALTERMRITSSGNVGIGTTNPARPLEIATGGMRFSSNIGDIEFTEVADLTSWATTTNWFPTHPAFRVHVGTGITQLFTVLNNGNVGVGTATPQAKLEVRGSIRLGSNGQYLAAGGDESLRIVRGVFDGQGAILTGFGFNVARTNVGTYTITFHTPFPALPSVTANPYAVFSPGFVLINAADASSVSFYLCKAISTDTSCNRYDAPVSFIVAGPR